MDGRRAGRVAVGAAVLAEGVLGWRLAARHGVARAALVWAVGLAVLTRALTGATDPAAATETLIAIAGVLAAVATPRLLLRGGCRETLRWGSVSPYLRAVSRVGGAAPFALAGATAVGWALWGPAGLGAAAVAGGALHAVMLGTLAAGLAGVLGCSGTTVLLLLLVAAGAGAGTMAVSPPLPPPGLAIATLAGGTASAADLVALLGWGLLGAAGIGVAARSGRGVMRRSVAGGAAHDERMVLPIPNGSAGPVVEPGEIVALLGTPPGDAGALLRTCAGLDGWERGGIGEVGRCGYVRAGLVGPGDVTVGEWLGYVAAHRGGPRSARTIRTQAALALAGLGADAGRRIALLDRDGAERLAVATMAASGVRVVLLDDCFGGVRLETRRALAAALGDLAMHGRTVLLAPRDVLAVERLATRVIVLRHGGVLADLRMGEVLRDRVAELRLNGAAMTAVPRILARFPDARRTGEGVAVPLTSGRSLEYVLAVLRAERIAVLGSRVRCRAVEDLVADAPAPPDPERVAALG